MDAAAYLKRHGWRGDGHSLDLTNRGIRKPLLVSRKVDVLGLGVNKHAAVSDQWWMRAFDQGLKNLGTGKESTLASVRKHGVHHGGLYGRFVRGETVPGTIDSKGWRSCASGEEQTTDPSITPTDSGVDIEDARRKKKRNGEDEAAEQKAKRKKKSQTKDQRETTVKGSGVNATDAIGGTDLQESTGDNVVKQPRKRKLSTTKLAEYRKRAEDKGVTLDEYIRRREKKYATKKSSKLQQPP